MKIINRTRVKKYLERYLEIEAYTDEQLITELLQYFNVEKDIFVFVGLEKTKGYYKKHAPHRWSLIRLNLASLLTGLETCSDEVKKK